VDILSQVDRLSLFKLLADRSRYAIYQEVAGADEPMSTNEIAERLALNPNTVRLHLEKMREAGLLEVSSNRHGSVGRPQHQWTAVPQAPSLGLEPAGFRLLAHLLAEIAAHSESDANAVAGVGRECGLERTVGRRSRTGSPRAACLQAVMDELADLGFDPALEPAADEPGAAGATGDVLTRISFTHCPFRELAVLYPDIVCQLHRGITEGILSGAVAATPGAAGRLESFGSLVDQDPCMVEMSLLA
jgi:predicted ArsR family transcriptional regulator